MEYVLGALAGLVWGGCVGFIKYAVMWRKMMKAEKEKAVKSSGLVIRMVISFAVDVAVLGTVFLLRFQLPFNYYATIIASAVGLSVIARLFPAKALKEQE